MNRFNQDAFLKEERRFVPYIMSGDPTIDVTVDLTLKLQEAGVTAIEWGVPFSDPLADGPVIQAAGQRAMAAGGSLEITIEGIKKAREKGLHIPVVLFTYVNPVLSMGFENVVRAAKEADVDGILIPDLPFEESEEFRMLCQKEGISFIFLIAPSSKTRLEKITSHGDGFLYLVTSLGVTGTRESFSDDLKELISDIQRYSTVPVLAGFGISTKEHVRHFQEISDGAIVGSALVREIEKEGSALLDPETKEDALDRIKLYVEDLMS